MKLATTARHAAELVDALVDSEDGTSKRIQGGGPWAMDPRQRRLSDEAVRRIQQKNGLRHADTADAALMWQQIDEAIDAGFRGADLAELDALGR